MKQKLKGWVETTTDADEVKAEEETASESVSRMVERTVPKEPDKWEAVAERQDGLQLMSEYLSI